MSWSSFLLFFDSKLCFNSKFFGKVTDKLYESYLEGSTALHTKFFSFGTVFGLGGNGFAVSCFFYSEIERGGCCVLRVRGVVDCSSKDGMSCGSSGYSGVQCMILQVVFF